MAPIQATPDAVCARGERPIGRAVRWLGSPTAAAVIAVVTGAYWGSVFLHARSLERREAPVAVDSGTEARPAERVYCLERTEDGWKAADAEFGQGSHYLVSRVEGPARHAWLAAPVERIREVSIEWTPVAGDLWSSRSGAARTTGSETERREALAALATWLESPVGGNDAGVAAFLREHPDGRSREVLLSGYVHTGVMGVLGALWLFSMAHAPAWGLRAARSIRLRRARAGNRCMECGYSAEGLVSSVCPECGNGNARSAGRQKSALAASAAVASSTALAPTSALVPSSALA